MPHLTIWNKPSLSLEKLKEIHLEKGPGIIIVRKSLYNSLSEDFLSCSKVFLDITIFSESFQGKNYFYSKDIHKKVISLRKKGLSYRKIGSYLSIPFSSVRWMIQHEDKLKFRE